MQLIASILLHIVFVVFASCLIIVGCLLLHHGGAPVTFNRATVTDSEDNAELFSVLCGRVKSRFFGRVRQSCRCRQRISVVVLHVAFSIIFDEATDIDSEDNAELSLGVVS